MMAQLTNEADVLDTVTRMNGRFLDSILSFSDDTSLRNLANAYEENRSRKVELGFNAFALVSDVYHRENFHSDVMEAILSPSSAHDQGHLYLQLFLEFLRKHHDLPLRTEDYEQAKLSRESGKIDLLILDDNSGKAIIIENKVNGAGDMDRQVIRYLEKVEDTWGYQCEAIIYLTLTVRKTPHTHGWTEAERARVKPLLRSIAAFEDSPEDLYQGWLARCHCATRNDEVAHVIRQYRQLLLKLGHNAMNKPLMEEYYNLMQSKERHTAALSLIAMMNDLPAHRCQKLYEEYLPKRQPFIHLFVHKPTLAIFEGLAIEGGSRLKIDLETWHGEHTKICFWDNDDLDKGDLPKDILTKIGLMDAFTSRGGRSDSRNFRFPDEEQAFRDFLDDFLQRLRGYVESTTSPEFEKRSLALTPSEP